MKIYIPKNSPGRHKQFSFDVNGVPYNLGNRKLRRTMFSMSNKIEKIKPFSKKYKLPKELLEKGKSKFLHCRLKQEKVENITQLYEISASNKK